MAGPVYSTANDILLNRLLGADVDYDVRVTTNGYVVLTQQYLEVITSGENNLVRLTQQYVETIHSGDANLVRLSQQYIEVIGTFGAPPVNPPKKDPPGKKKPAEFLARQVRHRARFNTRKTENDFTAYIPAQYLSPPNRLLYVNANQNRRGGQSRSRHSDFRDRIARSFLHSLISATTQDHLSPLIRIARSTLRPGHSRARMARNFPFLTVTLPEHLYPSARIVRGASRPGPTDFRTRMARVHSVVASVDDYLCPPPSKVVFREITKTIRLS